MAHCSVSILLPVYNAERFLRDCIDSILYQTLADFELIIINDGSNDDSEKIILSYKDPRIVYIKNQTNFGLIYSLNRGIDQAEGLYIARMDADDICQPHRLKVQKEWLDKHSKTSVVASFFEFIDENNCPAGIYEQDRKIVTSNQIRKTLPYQNCIAHPSVMGRSLVFRKYKYSFNQAHIEDYDLWLRIAGDGNTIEKIPQSLLLYRTHNLSITQTKLRKTNFFLKHFHCKRKYLAGRIKQGRFNRFDARVLAQMLADLVRAFLKQVKKTIIK